ncbi:hypothetical protein CVT24_013084 [Panaeolus cyanescens]|uniref:Pectate lyase domain-containing protein n=1 Tax=Panaeolus cyanescens TaxID=181874 RepID=A0A409VVD8_9AGAR|nr:hypothetical protein CVT24_013084 [Panaeolus cyanescens]
MKWIFPAVVLSLVSTVLGAPLQRRAAANDVADIGYATLNGGPYLKALMWELSRTTGGAGGAVTTVSTLAELTAAVASDEPKVVFVSGTITGSTSVRVGSNTSLLGQPGATLNGVGLRVNGESNVIIRNLKITKVVAEAGDAIGIQSSSRVWVDHVDLSSDRDSGKDFYDGLLDITRGCTEITVSFSRFSDHFKASLVGHSDNNEAQDRVMTVTYANNVFSNINSRTPSFRFGEGHIFNNLFEKNADGINTRLGAQLLVENNVFSNCKKAIFSTDEGFAVARGNEFGGATNTAPAGTLTDVPYDYTLVGAANVRSAVSGAGATLTF